MARIMAKMARKRMKVARNQQESQKGNKTCPHEAFMRTEYRMEKQNLSS
jgi:hypothetical protein